MKKVVLIDMDVLVKEPSKEHEEEKRRKLGRKGRKEGTEEHHLHWSDLPDIFLDLEPVDGAIDGFNKLSQFYDVYIVSTAPWNNSSAWSDKQKWVAKHLPCATKKLILTHHRNMITCDYLICSRVKNDDDKSPGKFLHFGQYPIEDWNKVLEYFNNN